jgi:serine/threonine-protein phosphatase 2A regulatory subunit B
MDTRPVEVHNIHDYLRSKLCALYENDCIFDKFECSWSASDRKLLTGSYNNFFRVFDRETKLDLTFEASHDAVKPRQVLKPRRVGGGTGSKRKKDEVPVDSLDFGKKILYTAWHPMDNIIAVAATNNLYLYDGKE